MRNLFLSVLFIFSSYSGFSQIKAPVKWAFSAKKINASTYEVHLTASLESGWHIYSQTTPDGGPVPTSVSFTKNPLFNLDGDAKEVGKLEKHFEDLFGVDVKQFSNKVSFVQTVKLKGLVKTSLDGVVEYMTCNDRECLPPITQKFSITLN
jgi:DsbC/DsbD-like thiol-disulfide interchange protein